MFYVRTKFSDNRHIRLVCEFITCSGFNFRNELAVWKSDLELESLNKLHEMFKQRDEKGSLHPDVGSVVSVEG